MNTYLRDIGPLLSKIKCKNVIVIGDININLLNETFSRDYMFFMSSIGLSSYVNTVTRPSSKTCLDHVFCRLSSNFQLSANVSEFDITDHSFVTGNLHSKLKGYSSSNKVLYKPVIQYPELIQSLEAESWNDVYFQNDPNLAYNVFIETLSSHLNKNTNYVKLKGKHTKIKPWITHDLIDKINAKNKLHKNFKRTPNDLNLKAELKLLSKEIKILTAKTKADYYMSKFKENGHDSKNKTC